MVRENFPENIQIGRELTPHHLLGSRPMWDHCVWWARRQMGLGWRQHREKSRRTQHVWIKWVWKAVEWCDWGWGEAVVLDRTCLGRPFDGVVRFELKSKGCERPLIWRVQWVLQTEEQQGQRDWGRGEGKPLWMLPEGDGGREIEVNQERRDNHSWVRRGPGVGALLCETSWGMKWNTLFS
jgi:hypothetical protein